MGSLHPFQRETRLYIWSGKAYIGHVFGTGVLPQFLRKCSKSTFGLPAPLPASAYVLRSLRTFPAFFLQNS